MATIKAKFRAAAASNSLGRVYYQVIHKREVKRITSDIGLLASEWDFDSGRVGAGSGPRARAVKSAASALESDLALLAEAAAALERQGREYTASDVAAAFSDRKSAPPFLEFMQRETARKAGLGKEGTAKNYRAACRSFRLFLGGGDIPAAEVTGELMERYQAWLSGRGVSSNSASFYMRILRCVYNHAVKKGLAADCKPFEDVYTGVDRTRKRAITASDMKRIKSLDLESSPGLERARDLFMLSFYCMGMSFVDLAMLKKTDVANGRLTYKRAKTGQAISVAVNPKMASMFAKYSSGADSPYLLDIVRDPMDDERRQYQNELSLVNRRLKKVGRMAGLGASLTTYVSRHSWASIARSKNVRISTISDALGHESESTTQIYLASLDTGHVDKANELIIKGL